MQDQEIVITVDRQEKEKGSALRAAFAGSVRLAVKEDQRGGREEGERGDGGGGGGGGDEGRRRRRRRRAREIEIPADQVPDMGLSAPAAPEPHWTELPLADKFRDAARDRDGGSDDGGSGGRQIRRSRSARGPERGEDGKNFERER